MTSSHCFRAMHLLHLHREPGKVEDESTACCGIDIWAFYTHTTHTAASWYCQVIVVQMSLSPSAEYIETWPARPVAGLALTGRNTNVDFTVVPFASRVQSNPREGRRQRYRGLDVSGSNMRRSILNQSHSEDR